MPGAQGPKTVKRAQSDPNYVSRLLARSECLPVGGIIVTIPVSTSESCVDREAMVTLTSAVVVVVGGTGHELYVESGPRSMHVALAMLVCEVDAST